MIHIFKHSDGTYDRATVRKGRFIHGSNQRYERKIDVIKTIVRDLNEVDGCDNRPLPFLKIDVQDDTGDNPVMCEVHELRPYLRIKEPKPKRMKKYIPNNNKSKK